jgi:hypothetical protein
MSRPGTQPAATLATREIWRMSLISAAPAPGYWIFTATSRPSVHTARCTCPMDAEATGWSSNDWNRLRHRVPKSARITSWTDVVGIGGALS